MTAKDLRDASVSIEGSAFDLSHVNLSDHSSNVWSIRGTSISIIILVGVFVGLRLLVRAFMVRHIFLDDVLILVASIFTIALAALCYAASQHGLGTHIWLLGVVDETTLYLKLKLCIQYLFVVQIFYTCAIAFTKLAIIASYLRFVPDENFHIVMWVTGGVTFGWWIASVLISIFQCNPVYSAWDVADPNRKCINDVAYLYATSGINVFTDIVLTVVPWPYFWRLPLPLTQRVVLCLLLGGGTGACVAAIVRVAMMHELRDIDFPYKAIRSLDVAIAECGIGIILVSIPILRPLAVRFLPRAFRSQTSACAELPPHRGSLERSSANTLADVETQEFKPAETNGSEAGRESKANSDSGKFSFPVRSHSKTSQ